MQPTRTYRTSRNLFSEVYLEEHLPETDAWEDLDDETLRAARDDVVELWERESGATPGRTDARLKASFVRSVFRALGIPFEVEERAGRTRCLPDYGFFESETAARSAVECREEEADFYGEAVAVADVKRRGRPLDALAGGERGGDPGNPSYQMHVHLQETPVRWGVLTDGRTWRLYYEPTSHRLDSYYEIDLPALLEAGGLEDFRYFYLFFRHGAFVEDAGGDCFLDGVYAESSDFTRELGERLRENVREAVEVLSAGFLQYPENDLTEDDLDRIHEGSLVYLYRLLFVLYAQSAGRESFGPNEECDAESDGLNRLKRDAAAELDGANPSHDERGDALWSRLDERFGLVRGNTSRDGPGSEVGVPAYAGRLFRSGTDGDDSPGARFLAENRVSDAHLAEVVDLLTRCQHDPGASASVVDYAALDVRHLGDIYEDLLEYELEIAAEPLTLDGDEYAPAREGDGVVVAEGEVHLATGSGQRSATGTYYTPKYVVEYIVERTVGPLVEEIRECLHDRSLDDRRFAEAFAERVFELDVVDPAMGSGHFLTSAVDYLTCEIVGARERQAVRAGVESVDETRDVGWIRRQVARRCLYGVDLNPFAVELAKASLWLRTADAERPPATLDHHLKTGNALVGSSVEEIDGLESAAGSDETATPPSGLERDEHRRRATATANVHTAGKFGLDGLPDDAAGRMAASLDDDEAWERIERTGWFQAAQERAANERFFHWRLAYPDVFSDGSGDEGAGAGFDAVIGNPPYVRSRELPEADRTFYREQYRSAEGAYDVYVPFMELATDLGDQVSFVVPNKWTTTGYGRPIRELLLEECTLHELVDVSHLDVFRDAEIYPLVVSYSSARVADDGPTVRHVATPENIDETAGVTISRDIVEQLGDRVIPVNLAPEFAPILEKALARESRFGDHVVTTEAIHTGNVREKLVVEEKVDESCEKLADGRSIDRYRVEWSGEWIRYDDGLVDTARGEYADLRDRDRFDRDEKLFLRDISYRPVAAYDDRQLFGLNTLYSVTRSDSSECSLKYLLAIFNSEFVNRYFRQVYGGTHVGGDYLRFKPTFTDEIPVPEPSTGGLPDGHERRIAEFDPTVDTSSTVAAMEDLTDRIREAIAVKRSLNLDLVDALGEYSSGPQLGALSGYRPAAGATRSPLADTARSREKLRVGSVEIREGDGTLSLWASARYKPDGEGDRRTDRWGYTETDPLPAMEFVGLSGSERLLVREFVPAAVEEAGGFAGFRETATKTASLLDRLERITLPAVSDVRSELERYRKDVRTAARMDERIEGADGLLDEIVYDLYDLTAEQRATVEALGE